MGTKYVYGDIPYQIMWQSITLMKKLKQKYRKANRREVRPLTTSRQKAFVVSLRKNNN